MLNRVGIQRLWLCWLRLTPRDEEPSNTKATMEWREPTTQSRNGYSFLFLSTLQPPSYESEGSKLIKDLLRPLTDLPSVEIWPFPRPLRATAATAWCSSEFQAFSG